MGAFDQFKDLAKMQQAAKEAEKLMEELRATGVSRKGYVKVTLDGKKGLKNIEFSDEAMKITPDELAKCVKEAHKAAGKEIDKLVKQKMKNSGLADFFKE